MRNIYLTGMPGCGKTTFGKALAQRTGREFYDIDEEIARREGPIPEIFQQKGEAYFREKEAEMLRALGEKENAVVSTGGGIIKDPGNIAQMKRTGTICFLDRPLSHIRGDVDRDSRPLLQGGEDKLKALYRERYQIYVSSADRIVKNDKRFEEIVAALVQAFPSAESTV